MANLLNILLITDTISNITAKIKKHCKIVMSFKIVSIKVKICMITHKKNQMMLRSINRLFNKKFKKPNNKICNTFIL